MSEIRINQHKESTSQNSINSSDGEESTTAIIISKAKNISRQKRRKNRRKLKIKKLLSKSPISEHEYDDIKTKCVIPNNKIYDKEKEDNKVDTLIYENDIKEINTIKEDSINNVSETKEKENNTNKNNQKIEKEIDKVSDKPKYPLKISDSYLYFTKYYKYNITSFNNSIINTNYQFINNNFYNNNFYFYYLIYSFPRNYCQFLNIFNVPLVKNIELNANHKIPLNFIFFNNLFLSIFKKRDYTTENNNQENNKEYLSECKRLFIQLQCEKINKILSRIKSKENNNNLAQDNNIDNKIGKSTYVKANFFYKNHFEETQVENTLAIIEELFSIENLNEDYILRELIDEDGYVYIKDLVEKYEIFKIFNINKQLLFSILSEHRQNEITETVETFDDMMIRNRNWFDLLDSNKLLNKKDVMNNTLLKINKKICIDNYKKYILFVKNLNLVFLNYYNNMYNIKNDKKECNSEDLKLNHLKGNENNVFINSFNIKF